jgi:hypothetical protein
LPLQPHEPLKRLDPNFNENRAKARFYGGKVMPNYGENLREQLLEKALRETGNEEKLDEINEIMIQFYAGKKVDLPIKADRK